MSGKGLEGCCSRRHEKVRSANITSQQAIQQIDKIRINKSPRVDEVFPRVLKECKNMISEALLDIFNKSVTSGDVLPSLWRQVKVIPIFKKGNKSVMNNYQPISLTSVIGKILEYIIFR